MDRHDPNQWTKEFVLENKDFCIRVIKDHNNQVIDHLKKGEHKLSIVGLDRIMNGLVTMINAGYDYRSQVCFFSWIEANIMLFGNLEDAPEQNRIKTAKDALLDAKDFAKDETTKKTISEIINDINKGYSLSTLASKYAEDFPDFETEALTNLNKKLDNYSAPAASVSATNSPTVAPASVSNSTKKPWWLIIVVIILALVVIVRLMTQENAVKSPALADTVQTTESTTLTTTTETTTEIATETTTETTTDPNKAMLRNIVGNWVYTEISEGTPNPEGGMFPAIRDEAYYYFYENGRYSVGDARYEEASDYGQAHAENIDGRYWICVGGGGQQGSYTINGNQITFVTDDSVQYGPSTTTTITFTLDGDTLIIEHNYGSTVYKRTNDAPPNEY